MRRLLKGMAWLLGTAVVALALWFGVNATDEALAPATLAALQVAQPPAPDPSNGYVDMLGLTAPEGATAYDAGLAELARFNRATSVGDTEGLPTAQLDPRIRRCKPVEDPCLAVAATPGLRQLIDRHRRYLERYRAMREKPVFVDLLRPATPDSPLPNYGNILDGQRLALLEAAMRFNAGDRAGAVRELEEEFDFHRKVAVGARTLITKMIAFAAIDRAALFAAELAHSLKPADRALLGRLEALLRAPTKEEADVTGAIRSDRAQTIGWMRTRDYVRLSDATYEMFKSFGWERKRPWWDPVAPYLYRPHQSVNHYAVRTDFMLAVAEVPPSQFLAAVQAGFRRVAGTAPGVLEGWILNPVGNGHFYLAEYDVTDYVGRAHAQSGVLALVRLFVKLRAAGISTPADVQAALAGPLGREQANPFTGEPMRFDPARGVLGFEVAPKYLSGVAKGAQRDGVLELRL